MNKSELDAYVKALVDEMPTLSKDEKTELGELLGGAPKSVPNEHEVPVDDGA